MTEQIEISTDKNRLNIDYIWRALQTLYWAKGISKHIVEQSIANSFCFGVYQDHQQIGFARVITDFTIFAYLADVFIDKSERKKGYARRLLQAIFSHRDLQQIRRWHLVTKDAQDLYKQFGFSHPKDQFRHMEKTSTPEFFEGS